MHAKRLLSNSKIKDCYNRRFYLSSPRRYSANYHAELRRIPFDNVSPASQNVNVTVQTCVANSKLQVCDPRFSILLPIQWRHVLCNQITQNVSRRVPFDNISAFPSDVHFNNSRPAAWLASQLDFLRRLSCPSYTPSYLTTGISYTGIVLINSGWWYLIIVRLQRKPG